MIGFKVTPVGSSNFFTSEAVMKALTEGQRRVLSKFGAYVRTRAKSSIRPAVIENRKEIRQAKKTGGKQPRPRYRPSAVGEPPRSRRGDLKRFILFGYDVEERNVVIGPTLVGGRPSKTPGRLERGGQFRHKRSGKMVRVAKRPFMRPAFEIEMKARMPAMFADSLVPIGR